MINLQIGSTYEFTLKSGKKTLIIVHGSSLQDSGITRWEISVDGTKGDFATLNAALGEGFIQIKLIP